MSYDPIGAPGALHLIVFGVLLPIAAWRSAQRIDHVPLPPRKRYYVSVLVQQALFGAFSLWVATRLGIELFPPLHLSALALVAGAALLALAVALLYPRWVRAVEQRTRWSSSFRRAMAWSAPSGWVFHSPPASSRRSAIEGCSSGSSPS